MRHSVPLPSELHTSISSGTKMFILERLHLSLCNTDAMLQNLKDIFINNLFYATLISRYICSLHNIVTKLLKSLTDQSRSGKIG
jgi:hypothetical protein